MKNKSKLLIPVLISSLLFTGCGAGEKNANEARYDNASSIESYGNAAEDIPEQEINAENSDDETDISEKENNTSQKVIRKEMLVYSCNMTVDVLDFDNAIGTFKDHLDTYSAFVEKENYNDGGSSDRWVYEDEKSWKTYNATVRVPSKDYDNFCDNIATLGKLRKKDANVNNLTSEYYDLSTTLEIYEAKEDRYIELLSTIDDKQTAIAIEKELTDIQIQISKLATRMNEIQTDVAYSYVYLTINEVREYVEEPAVVKTDTFGQRFKNTVSKSASGFLSVMETLLFIFIYLLPHLIVIGLFIFAIAAVIKAIQKHKRAKYMQNIQQNQTINAAPPVQATPNDITPDTDPENN